MKHLLRALLFLCAAFSVTPLGTQAVAQEWPTRASEALTFRSVPDRRPTWWRG